MKKLGEILSKFRCRTLTIYNKLLSLPHDGVWVGEHLASSSLHVCAAAAPPPPPLLVATPLPKPGRALPLHPAPWRALPPHPKPWRVPPPHPKPWRAPNGQKSDKIREMGSYCRTRNRVVTFRAPDLRGQGSVRARSTPGGSGGTHSRTLSQKKRKLLQVPAFLQLQF